MIFRAKNEAGFYHMARLVKKDAEGIEAVSYYTIPESRTIFLGTDAVADYIDHNPDTPELAERLIAAAEYKAKDQTTFQFKYPVEAACCVKVSYGENYPMVTLKEFDQSGKSRSEIISATTAGSYYKQDV